MWKYQCKNHFLLISATFLVGVVFMAITFNSSMEIFEEVFADEIVRFMYSNVLLTYVMGGLSVSGLCNSILLIQYVMRKVALGPFAILLLLMFAPEYIAVIGVFTVIPCAIITFIGWMMLVRETNAKLKEAGFNSEKAFFEYYKSKYTLDESVKNMAEVCRKNTMLMSAVYALGIVAIIFIMVLVDNFLILVLAFFFYTYAFNLLLRYRASCIIPITALLYQECDPEKCASAIFYFSSYGPRFKLTNHTLLAQCMIYLNDPEFAKAVLIPYQRKDEPSSLNYYSLMSYIYYLTKDEDGLNYIKQEAGKIRLNYGRTGVIIQSEEMNSIQNKINLMNGELNTCKKYYLQAMQKAKFPFQQVDASYYIALISFVEEDYVIAEMYFNKVILLGNKISYVEKAKHYLSKIEALNLTQDDMEEA